MIGVGVVTLVQLRSALAVRMSVTITLGRMGVVILRSNASLMAGTFSAEPPVTSIRIRARLIALVLQVTSWRAIWLTIRRARSVTAGGRVSAPTTQ